MIPLLTKKSGITYYSAVLVLVTAARCASTGFPQQLKCFYGSLLRYYLL
jgi:hypothetical protein